MRIRPFCFSWLAGPTTIRIGLMASASAEYKSISLFSIAPDEPLPFSLAVLYKGRYLRYRNAGQALEVSRYNRFIYKRVGTLYVPVSEYAQYESYLATKSAEEQRSLHDSSLTPEMQFSNRIAYDLSHITRDVFMFDNELGRTESVKRVLSITRQTVEKVLAKPYVKIFESIALKSNDIIAHSARVSLIATYLAYQAGYVNPVALEYLAAAALLHDIGKTKIPLSDELDVDGETAVESEQMKQHPLVSCEMLKEMPFVPEEVVRIVREHHEYRDGTGYPNGLRGPKMDGLSKVFVIANEFDNIASKTGGDRDSRYRSALQVMTGSMRSKFDPMLLAKAAKILEPGT